MNELQEHVNKDVKEDIGKLYDHAKIANEEMAHIKADMSEVKNDIKWLKDGLQKVDTRTWLILTSVILGILFQIYQAVK